VKKEPKLLRGFFRLGVILFLSLWLLFIFLGWNDALKAREQFIFSQLSEYFHILPVSYPSGWLTEIAKSGLALFVRTVWKDNLVQF
jgi:hypothetical protein